MPGVLCGTQDPQRAWRAVQYEGRELEESLSLAEHPSRGYSACTLAGPTKVKIRDLIVRLEKMLAKARTMDPETEIVSPFRDGNAQTATVTPAPPNAARPLAGALKPKPPPEPEEKHRRTARVPADWDEARKMAQRGEVDNAAEARKVLEKLGQPMAEKPSRKTES